MLPKNAWKPYEPRFGFPIFRGVRTKVSFSIRENFDPVNLKQVTSLAKFAAKDGVRSMSSFVGEYGTLMLRGERARRLNFRLLITSRQGEQLYSGKLGGAYPPGGSIDVDVTEHLRAAGLPDNDYIAILIMSRGRADVSRSSPGSFSMTYLGDRIFTTYRTGGFARSLNDKKRKSHQGFRGINPKAVADNRAESSILLMNHASDPGYNESVSPHSILIREDGATREGPFGEIKPFGALERSMSELFGRDVVGFLAPAGGKGTVITTCPGVTLASIHLMRGRDGSSLSMEHSRPTHSYLRFGVPA